MLKKRERLLNLMDERLAGDVLKLNDDKDVRKFITEGKIKGIVKKS